MSTQVCTSPALAARKCAGIFAPSGPFDPDQYRAGRTMLEDRGWTLLEAEGLDARDGFLAGDDTHRLGALTAMLEDDRVDVLWAARGGYGAHRLLEKLDPAMLRAANKPLVGFSDVCALHAQAQRSGLISIHAPVITQLPKIDPGDVEAVDQLLVGGWSGLSLQGRGTVAGRAEGPLLGGCLSVLAPMVGTPYMPNLEGALLLLEDVGEWTYRIDRLMTQLRLAGVFDHLAGVALGHFTGCKARTDEEPTAVQVIQERVADFGLPLVADLPIGHGIRNHAVPLGALARLDADTGTLQFL